MNSSLQPLSVRFLRQGMLAALCVLGLMAVAPAAQAHPYSSQLQGILPVAADTYQVTVLWQYHDGSQIHDAYQFRVYYFDHARTQLSHYDASSAQAEAASLQAQGWQPISISQSALLYRQNF